jgi:hypothetical protein
VRRLGDESDERECWEWKCWLSERRLASARAMELRRDVLQFGDEKVGHYSFTHIAVRRSYQDGCCS